MKDLMACVKDIPIRGLSVTMPYKQEMVAALENSDPLTRQIGACNTVVRSADGKLYGFNTDVAGILMPLQQRLSLDGARILIVGAGGAIFSGSRGSLSSPFWSFWWCATTWSPKALGSMGTIAEQPWAKLRLTR